MDSRAMGRKRRDTQVGYRATVASRANDEARRRRGEGGGTGGVEKGAGQGGGKTFGRTKIDSVRVGRSPGIN